MMWRRSLRRPGLAGLPRGEPLLARLPALPGARREAQDLDLDAAALERARQDVGAGRGDRDRAAAHRARIVEQQRHHRVAELHVLLDLEGKRMQGIDDDARQARGIEHAFLEIEIPGAVLLRHQPALQAVGEPRHHALQIGELLVEIVAQPRQLLGVAEILGVDLLVELVGVDAVEILVRQRGEGQLRPPRLLAVGRLLALHVVGQLVEIELLGVHVGGVGLALGCPAAPRSPTAGFPAPRLRASRCARPNRARPPRSSSFSSALSGSSPSSSAISRAAMMSRVMRAKAAWSGIASRRDGRDWRAAFSSTHGRQRSTRSLGVLRAAPRRSGARAP